MGFVYLNSAKPFPGRSKNWGVGCAFVMELLSVQGSTWGKRGLFQAQIGVQGWATLWECFPLPITPVGSPSHSLRGVRFPTGKNEWEFPKLSRALPLECYSTELSIYSLQVSGTVSSLLRSFLLCKQVDKMICSQWSWTSSWFSELLRRKARRWEVPASGRLFQFSGLNQQLVRAAVEHSLAQKRGWSLVSPQRGRVYMNQILVSSAVQLGRRNGNFWRIK